jgi:hypothetical protein
MSTMSRFPRLPLFSSLARLVYPTFGPRPIEAINRSDIVRLLDQIEDERGQVMANRTLGIIGRVMNFHASRMDDFSFSDCQGNGQRNGTGKNQSVCRTVIRRSQELTDD